MEAEITQRHRESGIEELMESTSTEFDLEIPPGLDAGMISYAQNGEDVVLARLLEIIDNGVYIDVGAGHPILENVTFWLYKNGWSGVNVEPMDREASLLRSIRPRDETLQTVVDSRHGIVRFFEAPLNNRGASTVVESIADRYRRAGEVFETREIEAITLATVLGRFQPGTVHVVKIDVEGSEASVLAGADLHHHRPWVLVIEATQPNSQVSSSSEWIELVTGAGYVPVLFDGLNIFFVRDDLSEVQELLSRPANVFDRWVSFREVMVRSSYARERTGFEERIIEAENYAVSLKETCDQLRQEFKTCEKYALSLHADREIILTRESQLNDRIRTLNDDVNRLEREIARLQSPE